MLSSSMKSYCWSNCWCICCFGFWVSESATCAEKQQQNVLF